MHRLIHKIMDAKPKNVDELITQILPKSCILLMVFKNQDLKTIDWTYLDISPLIFKQ